MTSPAPDSFVVKLNQAGGALGYATFLGGDSDDCVIALAVDGVGRAYRDRSYPLQQLSNHPRRLRHHLQRRDLPWLANDWWCGDAFVSRLNPSGGELIYATFLGGSSDECGNAIVVDGAGKA